VVGNPYAGPICPISQFSKLNVADEAEDHLLKLWKFLSLNPSHITPKKSQQKIHAKWMMDEKDPVKLKQIDGFLNKLVKNFCSEQVFDSKLPLYKGETQWRHHSAMVDIGAYQLLLKRHLLETPLRLWPLIFNAAARPKDYETSLLASSVGSIWDSGSRVFVECKGRGGYEVLRLWSNMVNGKSIANCPSKWTYSFTLAPDFYRK
jgi:hypothetical protein